MTRNQLALGWLVAVCLASSGCEKEAKVVPRGATASTPQATAVVPDRVVEQRGQGFALGQAYPYTMKTTSWIALDRQSPLFDFDLAAEVELTPTEVSSESVSLAARFDQVRFTSRVPSSQPEFDKFAREFGSAYVFTLTRGRVTDARIANGSHPLVVGVLRTLSAALQFSGAQPSAKKWSVREFDTTGEYSAEYSAGNSRNEWRKRKERYLSVLLPKGQAAPDIDLLPELKLSEGTLRLSDEGRPTFVSLRDEVRLKTAQAPLEAKTTISLRAGAPHPAADAALALERLRAASRLVAADEPYQAEVSTASIDRAKIDGLTFSEIVSRLEELEAATSAKATPKKSEQAAKKEAERDAKLFLALGATFRQHPETIALAVKRIKANSAARMTLVDGLGSADTPEAQQALIGLALPESDDLRLRTVALIGLSRTPHPTEQATAALFQLADHPQLGTQARYGLGTYSRRFRERSDTFAAAKLGNFLLARLDIKQGELTVCESLRALANAGFAPVLGKISPFLADKRDQVRVDAVRAIASIDDARVDDLIVQKLAADSAKSVRLAAIDAIADRTTSPTLLTSLRKATFDEDPHVRYQAVKLLVRLLPKHPDLRDALAQAASRDEEQKIRDLAKAAL
jgi:hypothetical protein